MNKPRQPFSEWRLVLNSNVLLRNTFFNLIGFGIPIILTLLFTPTLLQRMGTEGYGLWKVIISVLGLMGVLEFGLGTTIAKFIAEYSSSTDYDGMSSVITFGLLLVIIGGILITLPLYFFAPQIAPLISAENIQVNIVEEAIRIVSFGFFPMLLKSFGLAVPQGLQRFGIVALMQTLNSVLTMGAAIILSLLVESLLMIILSTVIVLWFISLISNVISWQLLRPWNIHIDISSDRRKKLLNFMFFTGVSGLGRKIFNSLDQIVVGMVLGLSEAAYYSIIVGIVKIFTQFADALTKAIMPAASSWFATGNFRKLWKYFLITTGILLIINATLLTILLVFSNLFLEVWMGEEFAREALVSFRILLLVYAVMATTAPAYQILTGIGRPWIVTIGALIGGSVSIILILVFGKTYGLEGAAWANAASWIKVLLPIYVSYYLIRKLKNTEETF